MPIPKWTSNSPEVPAQFPNQEQETLTVQVAKSELGVKTLSVSWNPSRDTFSFVVPKNLKTHAALKPGVAVTRRKLLSAIATVYDPLRRLSPLTVEMKILFQRSGTKSLSWYEVLAPDTAASFHNWVEKLFKTQFLQIPRKTLSVLPNTSQDYTLLVFFDASGSAMAACVYAVSRSSAGYTSDLICAKTNFAPQKTLSVPRLKLAAMLLAGQSVIATIQAVESTTY